MRKIFFNFLIALFVICVPFVFVPLLLGNEEMLRLTGGAVLTLVAFFVFIAFFWYLIGVHEEKSGKFWKWNSWRE